MEERDRPSADGQRWSRPRLAGRVAGARALVASRRACVHVRCAPPRDRGRSDESVKAPCWTETPSFAARTGPAGWCAGGRRGGPSGPPQKNFTTPRPATDAMTPAGEMTCGFKKRGGRPAPACWRARRTPPGGACRPWPGPGVRVRPAGQKCRKREFCSTAFPLDTTPDSRCLVFGMGPPVARVARRSPLPVCCPRGTQLRGLLRLAGRCAPVVLLWGQEGYCGQQGIPDALQDHKDWSGERPGCGGVGVFWARPTDCFRRVCCCCNLPPLPAWASQHAAFVPCVSFAGRRGSMVCGGLGMGAGAARSYLGITHTCPLAILFLRPCAGLRALTRCNPPAAACAGVPNLAHEGCMRIYCRVRCGRVTGALLLSLPPGYCDARACSHLTYLQAGRNASRLRSAILTCAQI